MRGHTRDIVIYMVGFIKIRSGGLEPQGGGRNLPFPVTSAIGAPTDVQVVKRILYEV